MDELRDEAADLERELNTAGEGAPAGSASTQGQVDDGQRAPEGESPQSDAAAGASGGEFIPNPAPQLAAAFKAAVAFPLVRRMVPVNVLRVFDDSTIDQLADALGGVAQKYGPALARWMKAGDEYGVELKAAAAIAGVAVQVWMALQQPEPQDMGGAEVVEPVRGDPPNPAANVPPVTPVG